MVDGVRDMESMEEELSMGEELIHEDTRWERSKASIKMGAPTVAFLPTRVFTATFTVLIVLL